MSTTYDILTRYYQSKFKYYRYYLFIQLIILIFFVEPQVLLLLAFSMYTNGQKVFSAKKIDSPDVMYCLNGIRVLSIVWVIFGHCFGSILMGGVINMLYILEVSVMKYDICL